MPININAILLPIAYLLFLGILTLVGLMILNHFRGHGRVIRSLGSALFLVLLPKEKTKKEDERAKELKELIGVQEQLFSSLSSVRGKGGFGEFWYGPPHLTFEVVAYKNQIGFYMSVPRRLTDSVIKQVQSFYPAAEIRQMDDFTIFEKGNVVAGSRMKLKKDFVLPFKTYKELESDPLISIVNSMSKIQEGEGAALQIVFRPWKPKRKDKDKAKIVAKLMQEGQSFGEASGINRIQLKDITKAISGAEQKKGKEGTPKPPANLTQGAQDILKAVEEKGAQVNFAVNLRLVATAKTSERAESILGEMQNAFSQFSSTNLNNTHFQRDKSKGFIYNFSFRNFSLSKQTVLAPSELASIFHFPLPDTEVPKIKWLRAKSAPPPSNMPEEGVILGRNIYRGEETPVRIKDDDRRRHLYIVGQTGTGKSALLQEMVRQDIETGKGVGLIDPYGDLAEGVLGLIPQKRQKEVIYFNPADTERPMALNMLEYKEGEQKDLAVQEMIAIFMKLFPPEVIGPMFEHNMRNAMLTLMADQDNPGTIVEILRIFTDEDFMRYKLKKVTDPLVRDFWEKEMAKTTEFHRSEMLGYLISKVGRFVENEMMRNIIGQPHSAFDFRKIMDEGKILIVNLAKGQTGEVNSSLLGLILVGKLLISALSRGNLPQEKRRDFYLYIDEFQNFTTDSISTIMAEARKYRLNLTVAHQFIGQLDEKIRDSVFGNVGTLSSFRVGAGDAEFLAKHFAPRFSDRDLINIDNFNAYVRLMVNGETTDPFNMATFPPKEPDSSVAKTIIESSRSRYGREKAVVERDIAERSRSGKEGAVSEQPPPPQEPRF